MICEQCGKKITLPNYSINHFEGMYETFDECAECNLDYLIDRYMEFKDDFTSIEFHNEQLKQINNLTKSLGIRAICS